MLYFMCIHLVLPFLSDPSGLDNRDLFILCVMSPNRWTSFISISSCYDRPTNEAEKTTLGCYFLPRFDLGLVFHCG